MRHKAYISSIDSPFSFIHPHGVLQHFLRAVNQTDVLIFICLFTTARAADDRPSRLAFAVPFAFSVMLTHSEFHLPFHSAAFRLCHVAGTTIAESSYALPLMLPVLVGACNLQWRIKVGCGSPHAPVFMPFKSFKILVVA